MVYDERKLDLTTAMGLAAVSRDGKVHCGMAFRDLLVYETLGYGSR